MRSLHRPRRRSPRPPPPPRLYPSPPPPVEQEMAAAKIVAMRKGLDARDAGRWTSGEPVWTVDRLTQRARRLSGAG